MKTPVELNGRLKVNGRFLENEYGRHIQLFGISSWGQHKPEFLTEETFKTLNVQWNNNCVRLALYITPPGGYLSSHQERQKKIIFSATDAAIRLGMYVIIDWHVLSDQNPLVYMKEAAIFFSQFTERYGNSPNIIYEICNEPNGPDGSWENICEYANTVIPLIRKQAPDSVILVGTPCWSQEVDKALEAPLPYDNIMYTLHFYAATHKQSLRDRTEKCINAGLPVFVSEFSICTCTGNGELDYEEGEAWKELIEKYELSFICWNLSNWDESSSILKASTRKVSDWDDNELSDSGMWMKQWCLSK